MGKRLLATTFLASGIFAAMLFTGPLSQAGTSGPSCTGFHSNTTPPTTIRVLRYGSHDGNGRGIEGTQLGIEVVDFRSYVRDVLPAEWLPDWPADSLKAGAIAAKTYAWYMVNGGRVRYWNNQCYDVTDDIAYQRYIPNSNRPATNAAIDATWNVTATIGGAIFQASYQRTLTNNTNEACGSGRQNYPDTLSQYGSRNCANAGRSWSEILQTYYPGVQLSNIGGSAPGGAAAVYVAGQYRVFGVQASSGNVFVNTYDGGWHGWENLGGNAVGGPAVTTDGSRYDVFVVGADGAMHQRTWAGSWGAWRSLGGSFNPAGGVAAVYSDGQYRVFGVGADQHVYVNTYRVGWSGWESLGGSAVGSPAVTYHDGRFDVFVVGTDGAMHQNTWNASWNGWRSLGGRFGPRGGAAAVYSAGQYRVFGAGADTHAYVNTYNAGWTGWEDLGGSITGAPAVTHHDGRFDLFAIGTTGAMYQNTWTGSWRGWTSLNGNFK